MKKTCYGEITVPYKSEFLLQLIESYPRLKADAVLGSKVEYSAICSVKQIKSRCAILSP